MKRIERACFEAGIKLGALFHQFMGIPVGFENVDIVERAMESCVRLQPYVTDVRVRIDRDRLREKISKFEYTSLTPDMLYAEVEVSVGDSVVKAYLKWDEELRYPLMKIDI